MFYLTDEQSNVVRALDWSSDVLHVVLRHDTRRVELVQDLSILEDSEIEYTLLEVVNKKVFKNSTSHALGGPVSHLRLVVEAEQVLQNVELPEDNTNFFHLTLKRTAYTAAGLVAFFTLFGLVFSAKKAPVDAEPQIVQVMDRKQMEQMLVVPPRQEKRVVRPSHQKIAKAPVPKVQKHAKAMHQAGTLGVLGSLRSSKQMGGLKLDQAQSSAGIGRGGNAGSGGMQTAVYSKGLFAAPLGEGHRADGAGGYGTKGKGGGQAGYGKVSLVGTSQGFFEPVESQAWVDGGLDKNEIAAVIQRHISEVRYCYEQGLQQRPQLSGRLSMKFMIGARGSVTLAEVANSSLGNAIVENCIRDHLKTWNFPQPEGGVTVKVSYPFVLHRVSENLEGVDSE